MRNIYTRLLLLIAGATQRELARQVAYLKVENQILRGKLPARVAVTPQERHRLVRFGSRLGKAIDELVSIVHPGTLRRWIREARKGKRTKPLKKGRRPTAESIRKLVVKLAQETGWGYNRILGELRKLGIRSVSRSTVKNILKSNGLDPGPQRGVGTWDEFLKIHAATLWQCDFLSVKTLTRKGFRDLFVLVFLHVETRRVFVSPATSHPDETWVCEQANAFVNHARKVKLGNDLVMHDRDTKFTAKFKATLTTAGISIRLSPYRSPNMVAFAERFSQTLRQECLEHFVVFSRAAFEPSLLGVRGLLPPPAAASGQGQRTAGRRAATQAEADRRRRVACRRSLRAALGRFA
ncbi:MAG: DDE-type integrase/transposase/recombinase [Pirellulales bacterium]|nr:DDE-type integrase/transposase/recombinase [Pirellulales bacterium]